MKPNVPWSVKGIDPEAREAAKMAARRAGMTLGEWLNSLILQGGEPGDVLDEQSLAPGSALRPTTGQAVSGIDQSIERLASTIESSRRMIVDTDADTKRDLAELAGRLEAIEDRVSKETRGAGLDPHTMQALERAIQGVAAHIEKSDYRNAELVASVEHALGDLSARVNGVEEAASDAIGRLELSLDRASGRVDQVEGEHRRSAARLTERLSGLDERVEQAADKDSGPAPEVLDRIEALGRRLDRAESDLGRAVSSASAASAAVSAAQSSQIDRVELEKLAARIDESEQSARELARQEARQEARQLARDEARQEAKILTETLAQSIAEKTAAETAQAAAREAAEAAAREIARDVTNEVALPGMTDLEAKLASMNNRLDRLFDLTEQKSNEAADATAAAQAALESRIAETDLRLGAIEESTQRTNEELNRTVADLAERTDKSEHDTTLALAGMRELVEQLGRRGGGGQGIEGAALAATAVPLMAAATSARAQEIDETDLEATTDIPLADEDVGAEVTPDDLAQGEAEPSGLTLDLDDLELIEDTPTIPVEAEELSDDLEPGLSFVESQNEFVEGEPSAEQTYRRVARGR